MKTLLLAGTCVLGLLSISDAEAANIAAFSQTSQLNTVTATVNASDTQTNLSIQNAILSIGQFILGAPPPTVFFDLTASSIDAAVTIGTAVLQHFSGSFCLSTAINCGGVDVLSGSFTDAALGGLNGPGLVINTNAPPDSLSLLSDIIPASELVNPSSFGLTFTNLKPPLSLIGSTIAPFSASFTGSVSASAVPAPEPVGVAVLGAGLLGLGAVTRRRS